MWEKLMPTTVGRAGSGPPMAPEQINYRPADGGPMATIRCGTCFNMSPGGMCSVMQIRVDENYVSDMYKPVSKGDVGMLTPDDQAKILNDSGVTP